MGVIDILESKDLTKFLVEELTGLLMSNEARLSTNHQTEERTSEVQTGKTEQPK